MLSGGLGLILRVRLGLSRSKRMSKEKRWLSKTPELSGTRLERRKFKATPEPPELPPGFIPARAAVVCDRIMAAADYDDVVSQVVESAMRLPLRPRDISESWQWQRLYSRAGGL